MKLSIHNNANFLNSLKMQRRNKYGMQETDRSHHSRYILNLQTSENVYSPHGAPHVNPWHGMQIHVLFMLLLKCQTVTTLIFVFYSKLILNDITHPNSKPCVIIFFLWSCFKPWRKSVNKSIYTKLGLTQVP